MNSYKNFGIIIGLLLLSIFLHFILMNWILGIQKPYFSSIYFFVFSVLIISSLAIQALEKNFKEHLGYFFLVIVAVKLLAAKIFIDSFSENSEFLFRISLIVLYLICLVLITWFVAQKLLKLER
ncbi:MAG: hypothetical protein RBT46_08255 [Weeksellaceae bacterium]|nr:hypothetical protein [Weeksellaceae bacterium]